MLALKTFTSNVIGDILLFLEIHQTSHLIVSNLKDGKVMVGIVLLLIFNVFVGTIYWSSLVQPTLSIQIHRLVPHILMN